jgi:peroxiredoxin
VQRVALIAVVIALVASAFWLDRNRPAPVAGYGPILQPGGVTVVTGSGLAVGELAPDFRLRTTDGEIVELSSLRGQPVVLHFWTTWCLDCAADLPALQELAGAEGDGVTVLGIDVGEPAGRVQDAAARHGAGYPMLLDRDEAVAAAYGATAYPATVLVDASGVVQAIHQGPISPDELRSQVDDLGAGQ